VEKRREDGSRWKEKKKGFCVVFCACTWRREIVRCGWGFRRKMHSLLKEIYLLLTVFFKSAWN